MSHSYVQSPIGGDDPRDAERFNADVGFAIPDMNVINIYGDSGATTEGNESNTLTIYAPKYSSQNAGVTLEKNTGTFCATTGVYTLPDSAGLTDGDLIAVTSMIAAPDPGITLQATGTQQIYIGNVHSSAGGTAESTDIGDTLMLRYREADGFWYATSLIGFWNLA